MKTVLNIGMSLVRLYGWKVERFDIQRCNNDVIGHTWYIGYLYIIDTKNDNMPCTILIRDDGTFEIDEREV